MHQHQEEITVSTRGRGLYEITREVAGCVAQAQMASGLVTVFCRHTSASLLIQENADPDVRCDLIAYFDRLVPDGDRLFLHTTEGPDDMPAHVKGALTQTSLGIPIVGGRMALGTWQGIYLFEHRLAPHTRKLIVHAAGA
jgi:secondary thiamine-phosphate synthase enzyme